MIEKIAPSNVSFMMRSTILTDLPRAEDGKTHPEQLDYGDATDKESTSQKQSRVVVAIGCLLAAVIAIATILAMVWAFHLRKIETTIVSDDDILMPTRYEKPGVCLTEQCVYAANALLRNMDQSVNPCDNFYDYACGNWATHNPLPEDKSSYDTFNKLRDDLQLIMKELLSAPIADEDSNSTVNAKKLFQSCMNETIIEERKAEPLMALLKEFGGWPLLEPAWNESDFDVSDTLGRLKYYNNDIMIAEWVGADSHNSSIRIIHLDQPEFGLPSRDYYLQDDTRVLKAYFKYMTQVAVLLGADQEAVDDELKEILNFEQQLANLTEPAERRRNYTQLFFKVTLRDLQEFTPQLNWTRYFDTFLPIGLNDTEEIALYSYPYLRRLGKLLDSTPKRVVANYLIWRFVNHRVNNLDRRFSQRKQEFFQVLYGRSREPERFKTCTVYVNTVMGMVVGAMFVKKNFKEESKHDAEEMIGNIQESFIEILKTLDWMDEETKMLAMQKAQKISKKIGYPQYILNDEELDRDHEGLKFEPDKYFENVLHNLRHMSRWDQEKLRIPVNKTLWSTAPVVVNAFYSRSKNQILFPAGILQPPFYHSSFPRSMNYGGIGVVIGHEISHGFDDRGRQFDLEGNLKLWWSPVAVDKFHNKAQCIIEQYSEYVIPQVSLKINGIVTQGENIADNGGIRQAFRAYRKWVKVHGEEQTLPGLNLTHTQLFFLNFAQVWCTVMTKEAAVNKIRQGPHSPGRYRVIGTLSNSKEFSKAYNCPEGSPMNPAEKCSLW